MDNKNESLCTICGLRRGVFIMNGQLVCADCEISFENRENIIPIKVEYVYNNDVDKR